MTTQEARLLTEFLGECWHEWTATGINTWWCETCDEVAGAPHRLDFTDWRVVGRLIEKVGEMELHKISATEWSVGGDYSNLPDAWGTTPQEAVCVAVLAYLKANKANKDMEYSMSEYENDPEFF